MHLENGSFLPSCLRVKKGKQCSTSNSYPSCTTLLLYSIYTAIKANSLICPICSSHHKQFKRKKKQQTAGHSKVFSSLSITELFQESYVAESVLMQEEWLGEHYCAKVGKELRHECRYAAEQEKRNPCTQQGQKLEYNICKRSCVEVRNNREFPTHLGL